MSSAEVVQARDDVERISKDLFETKARHYHAEHAQTWEETGELTRASYRSIVTELLHRDVIRIGRRPQRGDPPMTGQTTFTPVDPLSGGPDEG